VRGGFCFVPDGTIGTGFSCVSNASGNRNVPAVVHRNLRVDERGRDDADDRDRDVVEPTTLPTTPGSPPKRERQYFALITATGEADGVSSSGRSVRPGFAVSPSIR